MKKQLLRTFLFLMTLCLLATGAVAETAPAELAAVETTVQEIQKYGNLVLATPGSAVLGAGYAYGDVVTATVNGQSVDMPVCSNYSDVDNGSPVLRVVVDAASESDYAIMAINMGDLATTLGLATKTKTRAIAGI